MALERIVANMAADKADVSFMQEYLAQAVEFEKYVYIWSNAMAKANSRMRDMYSRRGKLEEIRDSSRSALDSLSDNIERRKAALGRAAKSCKKKATVALVITLVDFAICLIACFVALGDSVISLRLFMSVPTYLGTIIGPVTLIIFIRSTVRLKAETRDISYVSCDGSRRRQEIILKSKESNAENDRVITIVEESVLKERQQEISGAMREAKNNLADIYAQDVLPERYRSFSTVATLYDYLETGRCDKIQGHGGIYDTYENDLRQGLIIERLTEISNGLSRKEANQQMLYMELRQANVALSDIGQSLAQIEKSDAEIAANTAISAVADQQTAASLNWMAWKQWANGDK